MYRFFGFLICVYGTEIIGLAVTGATLNVVPWPVALPIIGIMMIPAVTLILWMVRHFTKTKFIVFFVGLSFCVVAAYLGGSLLATIAVRGALPVYAADPKAFFQEFFIGATLLTLAHVSYGVFRRRRPNK